jgi:hypothetical protein
MALHAVMSHPVATKDEYATLQTEVKKMFEEFALQWGQHLAEVMGDGSSKLASSAAKALKPKATALDRQIHGLLKETSVLTLSLNGSRSLSSFLPLDSVGGARDSSVKKHDLTSRLVGCIVRVVSPKFGVIDITISSALLDTSLAQGFVVELKGEVVEPLDVLVPDSGELGVFKSVSVGSSSKSVVYRTNKRMDAEASIAKFASGATMFLEDGSRKLKELGFVTQANNADASMCFWLSVVQGLAGAAVGVSGGVLPPLSIPSSQPIDGSDAKDASSAMEVQHAFVARMARALRAQVLSFATKPLALLSVLFQLALKAVDVEDRAVSDGNFPHLVGVTQESLIHSIRSVLFSCMVAILGDEHVGDIRALSFFKAESTLATKLTVPTSLEAAIADQIAQLLNNRSASDCVDKKFAGVDGVRLAWLQVVDTSFKDGQFAGLEAGKFTALFLQLAQVATLRTLQPNASGTGVPVYSMYQNDNMPGLPADPLHVIMLALDHRILKKADGSDGIQYGHYEYASLIGGDASVRQWVAETPQSRLSKELLATVMETLRHERFAPASRSASTASAILCAGCAKSFEKVVASQVKCLACCLKDKTDGPGRKCVIGVTCDMSSALPTNSACDQCTAALKHSEDRVRDAAKKAQAAKDKEKQKQAAAEAEKLDAHFKQKQVALERERLLARDKLLHPKMPVANCEKCAQQFVQKVQKHVVCRLCHMADSSKGTAAASTDVESDTAKANQKADSTKAGQTKARPPQANATKSANQSAPRTEQPPSKPLRVNRAVLMEAVDRRVAILGKQKGAVLKSQVQAAIDKEVSSKRILEALNAGHCLSCDKCEYPRCKLKHPNDPAASAQAPAPKRAAPKSQAVPQCGATDPAVKPTVNSHGTSFTVTFADKVKAAGAPSAPPPAEQQPKTPPSPPPTLSISTDELSQLISSILSRMAEHGSAQ